MDAAAFRALVQRLERSAALQPARYRAQVAGLAVLGYAYILGALVLLVAITVMLALSLRVLALKLAIPLVIVIAAVLKALWVKVPPPDGLRLRPGNAPALFAQARDVARRLRAPRVHAIVARPELNAAVVQVPRLGVLGWYKNYLIVGLPLLQTVPPEEWQAILAHEMGHLSGSHGRFGAWIYRLRETWGRLLEQLEQERSRIGQFLFGHFVTWHSPYFNAYTFVLARAQEYEADRASAELVGPETARRALTRLEVVSRQAGDFWERLYAGAADAPEPPADVQRRLRAALHVAPPVEHAEAWVSAAWRLPTDYSDTHPALADRLRALGWEEQRPGGPLPPEPFAGPTAAQVYLGPAEATIEDEFERHWVSAVRQAWHERHAEIAGVRRRLAELDRAAEAGLPPESEWERIRLYQTLGDMEHAGTLAERLLERVPDHVGVRFYVAQVLLGRGDVRGLAEIEDVMRRNPRAALDCYRALFEYHWSRGDAEAAERYRQLGAQRVEAVRLAQAERMTMSGTAQFEPHGLDEETVATLRTQLGRYDLREAYCARRVVRHLPDEPCHVLGIVPKRPWWRRCITTEEVELPVRIARELTGPEEIYVFLLLNELKGLRVRLERIPGARVL